jgi:hypothetical protein
VKLRWLVLSALGIAVAVIIVLVATGANGDPRKEVRLTLAEHPVTVEVTRRPLVARTDMDGTIVAPRAPQLRIAREAEGRIVTGIALRRATTVREGDRIGSIEGRPVVALQGALPAYRDLSLRDRGPDVAQLMRALARLGLPCRCGERLTDVERDGVRTRLLGMDRSALGRRVVLPAASVVWVARLPLRIDRVRSSMGQPAKNPLATGRVMARRVLVRGGGEGRVRVGMKSVVHNPGGRRLLGRVVRVDRLSDRFWVSVPPLAVTRSDLPVVVTVELLRRRGSVPAIPAAAFRRGEGTEGSVGVVGADGAVNVRRVTAGPDLNGWIAIRRGLREGERVVVASWADDALR